MTNDILSIGKMRLAEPLDHALDHMRRLMFRPFDAGIWASFGVIIFLEMLLWNWWPYAVGSDLNVGGVSFQLDGLPEPLEEGASFAALHILAVAGVAAVTLLMGALVVILFTWVSSRGQLMIVRAVALGDSRIGVNWNETRPLSRSLFVFRLVVNLLGLAYLFGLALLCGLALFAVSLFSSIEASTLIAILSPAVCLGFLGMAAWSVVNALLREFVVPLMIRFDAPCGEGWRILRLVAKGNVPAILLYFIVRFALRLFIGMAAFLAGYFTCFIGFIPVVHQTLLAPFYVFERSFGLFVLQSLGPDFQMVRGPAVYRGLDEREARSGEDYR